MSEANSTPDGRDTKTGRFLPGNSAAKGTRNRGVVWSNRLRATLLSELTPTKIRMIVNAMFKRVMQQGDVRAAELLLRYGLGPAISFDLLERIADVERAAGIDSREVLDVKLTGAMLDYQFDDDGKLIAIRRRPAERCEVDDEGGDDES